MKFSVRIFQDCSTVPYPSKGLLGFIDSAVFRQQPFPFQYLP